MWDLEVGETGECRLGLSGCRGIWRVGVGVGAGAAGSVVHDLGAEGRDEGSAQVDGGADGEEGFTDC